MSGCLKIAQKNIHIEITAKPKEGAVDGSLTGAGAPGN